MIWSIALGIIVCLILINAEKFNSGIFTKNQFFDYLDSDLAQSTRIESTKHAYWGVIWDDDDAFICTRVFSPTETLVELMIEKVEDSEPTEIQRAFYEKIENQYNILIDKMIPLIENECNNWRADFKIKDFKAEFYLDWMTIPKNIETDVWELGFTSLHDKKHIYTIYFKELEPLNILIEG